MDEKEFAASKFQHQPHDHVLKEEDRRRNVFERACHYIPDNPRVAELAKLPEERRGNWKLFIACPAYLAVSIFPRPFVQTNLQAARAL